MWPFKSKSLKEKLSETKKVKIEGVLFEIKKIDPLDYINGSKAMLAVYDKYKVGGADIGEMDLKNFEKQRRAHLKDVIMAGVVKPELARKAPEGDKVLVDEIFASPTIAQRLYDEIINYTYKKKAPFLLTLVTRK